MSRFTTQYEIARPTGRCAATGRVLEPGEACIVCLCDREADDAFERVDYSIEAWDRGERPARLFSFWRTTVPEANVRRKVFVDDELLMNMFERLADDERPQRVAFRFVLALVLMRKRLLRSVGRVREGGVDRWLVRPKTVLGAPEPQTIEVVDPHLSDEDVRAVSDQLGEILSGELE